MSGIWGHPHAVPLTRFALYALQHRGQESAGIAAACRGDGELQLQRGSGLVADVFEEETLDRLRGDCAVGHVRYATAGDSSLRNAQPLVVRLKSTSLGLAHNGNLTNAGSLRRSLQESGSIFQSTSDTEVIAHLTARASSRDIEDCLLEALRTVRGGYALVALTPGQLFAARDAGGIRPL
ncbi:MAG: class II glutamine amidotransferase, partial [Bacillota bacterium]